MTSALRVIALGSVQSFAVVSDVHMRSPNDAQTRLFLDCIKNLTKVDVLFCLGDIFDFVFAGDRFYVQHWKEVFGALADLQKRGVRVVFLEGNHDYGFEHFLHATLRESFTVAADAEVVCTHPILGEVVLRHGDDIVCPWHYLWFRKVVKSRVFQSIGKLVPGRLTNAFFNFYARLSRKRDVYRTLEPAYLWKCVGSFLRGHNSVGRQPDVLVIGHVHQHVDALWHTTRVIVGDDWFSAPNILVTNAAGQMQRTYLTPVSSEPWREAWL